MADTWNTPPIVPNTDSDSSIGYANKRWKDVYAVNLHGALGSEAQMAGATSSADGKSGAVPAPAAGSQNKFLRGDGTWQDIALSAFTVADGKLCIKYNEED